MQEPNNLPHTQKQNSNGPECCSWTTKYIRASGGGGNKSIQVHVLMDEWWLCFRAGKRDWDESSGVLERSGVVQGILSDLYGEVGR
jgi:hypothetical protein